MTKEEIIRNLKYTMEKHKNDTVHTFDTNILVMCKDILDYFEEQDLCADAVEQLKNYTHGKKNTDKVEISVLALNRIIKTLSHEPKTIQEKQAESEKYQKVFDDGYANGYAQARFDYEQEPCEDCISRQAVLDLIADYDLSMGQVVKCIHALPPVTPQPKTGHWIECMPRGTEEWSYKCSECNFWKYKKTINLSKFKFCPNCGCRMVEESEE